MARSTGRLVLLPYALDYLAGFHILTGEFSRASGLVIEAEGLDLRPRRDSAVRLAPARRLAGSSRGGVGPGRSDGAGRPLAGRGMRHRR